MSMELEYQLLAVTTQNISKVDYQLSPEKLAELEALIKTMEEIKNMMEQSHDEVVVDGVLYTATQTAAKYAFEAFDNGVLSIGNIITETRYLIESIELVVDKTGDQYFQKSLITDLKEPLINLGHWIATMRSYTENIQQNYFRQSILVLLKVEKNYNKNKDLYTQVYQEWSKSELARTDDFQSNWVDIEKTINKIAEQYLSAFSSRKIMDMMAKVARMFNFQCEQVNKDLLNKKEELIKAEQRLAEKENTRNQLNFLWFAFWIAAAISQAVMASEVAAAQAAVKNAYTALKEAIASGNEHMIVRGHIVKALTQMNAISHLHPTLLSTAQIMKFTTAKVTSLVKETKIQIEQNQKYNPQIASTILLEYYQTNSELLVKYVQAWDILQSKTIMGKPTINLKLI